MTAKIADLAQAASRNERPAFVLVLLVAEQISYDHNKRLAINQLREKFRLLMDTIVATHDIAVAVALCFSEDISGALLMTDEQVNEAVADAQTILSALESVSSDNQGRVSKAEVVRLISQARTSATL